MDEFLDTIRTQLSDEIDRLRARADVLERVALATVEAAPDDAPPVVVRPPATDVPAEPVTIPKAPKRERRPAAKRPGGRPIQRDYEAIAKVAREAIVDGKSATAAVAGEFSVTDGNARQLIAAARQKGHDIPRTLGFSSPATVEPARNAVHPMMTAGREMVLACTEDGCDFEIAADRPVAMAAHARQKHDRMLTADERRPVVRGAAA